MKKFIEYYLIAGAAYASYKMFGSTQLPISQAAPLVVTWPLAVTGASLGGLGTVQHRRMPPQRRQNPVKPYVSPHMPY